MIERGEMMIFNTEKKLKNKHMFYCYDLKLAKYLREECGFHYITHALSVGDEREFYLFLKSNALNKRIREFQKLCS